MLVPVMKAIGLIQSPFEYRKPVPEIQIIEFAAIPPEPTEKTAVPSLLAKGPVDVVQGLSVNLIISPELRATLVIKQNSSGSSVEYETTKISPTD